MYRTLAEALDSLDRGTRVSTHPEDRKLVTEYLAALAPLLARSVLGQDILGDLPSIERLLGHTWLIDQSPFDDGLLKLREFIARYTRFALTAMPVNERLLTLGTLETFDSARAAGDLREVQKLLEDAYVDAESVQNILREMRSE
jgi:hypothetical protein